MHVGHGRLVLHADRLKLRRHRAVIEALAADRVALEQLGADERAAEIVRHQPPDVPRLEHVAPHLLELLRGGLETRRDDVAAGKALLDNLDKAHVRRVQRGHGGAVHAREEKDVVGDLLELGEERRIEDVAVLLDQRHDHPVGAAAEGLLVLGEGLHVRMRERDHLAEPRVHAQPGGTPAEEQRDGGERDNDRAPVREHRTRELFEKACQPDVHGR